MSRIAVLGAGAGGAAAAAELSRAGHEVRLWNRRAATIAPHLEDRRVRFRGVWGEGSAELALATTDLAEALDGAEGAVACLPALAHAALAADLAAAGLRVPLVLHPGHTLGALHVAAAWRDEAARPPLAELSTLGYVARKDAAGVVDVTGVARRLRVAGLPGSADAVGLARELWPAAVPEADVLATSLANVNLALHPPAAILGAAWVEATGGGFRYYADATTPAVARVLAALDAERLAVAAAFGHRLDPLGEEMRAIGTIDAAPEGGWTAESLGRAVASGAANSRIRAPESLDHRYYREDFGYGIVPLLDLARLAGVPAPVAGALLALADAMLDGEPSRTGLTLARLGLRPASAGELVAGLREESGGSP